MRWSFLEESGKEGGGFFVAQGYEWEDDVTEDLKGSSEGIGLAKVGELPEGLPDRVLNGLLEGDFSPEVCLEVLRQGVPELPLARRPMLNRQGRAVLFGLYSLGGFHGVSNATRKHEEVVRYLNGYISSLSPEHVWTTLYLTRNTQAPMHRDLRNSSEFPVLVTGLGDFVGGGLWVQGEFGDGPVIKVLPGGDVTAGSVFDVKKGHVVFPGTRWHAAEAWEGLERWVIAAFVPRAFKKATDEHWEKLRDLGFPVEGLKGAQGGPQLLSVGSGKEDNSELRELGVKDYGDWEVGVPVPVMNSNLYDQLVHWHGCVAKQCRLLTAELCDAIGEAEILIEVARLLRSEELLAEWLERSLAVCGGVGEVGGIVKALGVEVPLGPEASSDTFLQTRTVGLAEARKELNLWVEPAQDEVLSLETVNRAVDRVQDWVVEEWVSQGMTVVQLPGKVVLTRKSGTGKRRCRAVCCGNHLPTDKLGLTREELYASGAESLSVKVSLTFAARNRLWVGVTIDVKSAFLYAPIRSDSKGTEERIVVKPPGFLVELGVLSRGDRWWIRKALYGLPTSPRDWGRYRDDEFTRFKLKCGQQEYSLFQTKSDSALWLARRSSEGFLSEICGILVVYVDDLAFFGRQAFITEVQGHWKTSEPEWLGKEPVTFCGIELTLHGGGYRMSQRAYVQELLNRYGIEDSTSVPIAKWVEPEVGPPPSVEEVREAQGITGALLWISTRTRPDLAYLVSRCGQQATKAPQWSISYGKQALAYLKGTQEFGIEVPFDVGKTFSDHGLLAIPDASHSPGGDRSMQSTFIVWRGVPVAWEATRQPFTTLSSAESELVSMMHGVQLAEAVQPLLDELLESDTVISLLADNEAAIRAFECSTSGWRNRHLRMHAAAGRERVETGSLKVSHLPGEFQVADLGTKPLSRPRIVQLLGLINIGAQSVSEETVGVVRALSRLAGKDSVERGLSAEALAGLALLAVIPGVNGQPNFDPVSEALSWFNWLLAWIVVAVCFLGGSLFWALRYGEFWGMLGFVTSGPNQESGEMQDRSAQEVTGVVWVSGAGFGLGVENPDDSYESELEVETAEESTAEVPGASVPAAPEEEVSEGLVGLASGGADSESSDFSPQEWQEAQRKLEDQERRTGLTFVQRVRLRKQIAAGGVVEPPVLQQRFGGIPYWLGGTEGCGDQELEDVPTESEVQGSASAQAVTGSGPLDQGRGWLVPRGPGLLSVLMRVGGSLSVFLGAQIPEWRRLRCVAREFSRNLVLLLLASWQDSGSAQVPTGVEGRAEFQFGSRGWRLNTCEVTEGRSRSLDDEGDELPVQVGGSSSSWEIPPVPGVQIGGSSSSANPPPPLGSAERSASSVPPTPHPDTQVGGSSSSHGIQVAMPESCYEDYFDQPNALENFPLVGTWLAVHFLVQLMSYEGSRILGFLGDRSGEWLVLRTASIILRYAVAGAVVDELRQGPYAVQYSGPNWFEATEEYMLSREVQGPVVVFPYVLWGPPHEIHYLWRLFTLNGATLLFFLGDRVREWAALRPVARGFRSNVVLALVRWLEATGPRAVADTGLTYEAAETYWRTGRREFPFDGPGDDEDVDQRPHGGPRLREVGLGPFRLGLRGLDSSSEESTETSATDPSTSEEPSGSEAQGPVELGAGFTGVPVTTYAAEEGALVVFYADDSFRVPLPGWSLNAVQGVVDGLGSGQWPDWHVALQQPFAVEDSGNTGQGDASRTFLSLRLRSGIEWWFWVLVYCWAFVGVVQGHEISGAPTEPFLENTGEPYELQVLQVRSVAREVVDHLDSYRDWCDGSALWRVFWLLVWTGIWEILRRSGSWARYAPKTTREVGCQTDSGKVISLPLGGEVPHRARILFCLWKAGHLVEVDSYPDKVQDEFHWLVGDYLSRVEEGLVSESD